MKKLFLCLMLFCSFTAVFAADFGLILTGAAGAESVDEVEFSGKVILAPWFSATADKFDFFFSLGLTADYDKEWFFIPELFRLEFDYRPISSLGIRVGRIPWQDTTRFIVKGNFDGADIQYHLKKAHLGAAVLYTGLLYKETADVNSSAGDPTDYSAGLDFTDFAYTYFAPRRLIASVYGEFPSILFERGDLYAGFLAQFDLSDSDEKYNTQYLVLRYTHVYRGFDLNAAAALELENTDADGIRMAYAFSLEGGFQMNTSFFVKDRLSLNVRFSSGDGPTAAFFPIIREAQGVAFKPSFSGIMVIRANYEALIVPSLSLGLGARYFIRTDSSSCGDPYSYPYLEDNSNFLGGEIDLSMLWVPLSDLSFSLNGGFFLPKTGGAFASGAPVIWTVSLGAVFSF